MELIYGLLIRDEINLYDGLTSAEIKDGYLYVYWANGNVQNVGAVTAYASAVKNGYNGTFEQWELEIANWSKTAALIQKMYDELKALALEVQQNKNDSQQYKNRCLEILELINGLLAESSSTITTILSSISLLEAKVDDIIKYLKYYWSNNYNDVTYPKLVQQNPLNNKNIVNEMFI